MAPVFLAGLRVEAMEITFQLRGIDEAALDDTAADGPPEVAVASDCLGFLRARGAAISPDHARIGVSLALSEAIGQFQADVPFAGRVDTEDSPGTGTIRGIVTGRDVDPAFVVDRSCQGMIAIAAADRL